MPQAPPRKVLLLVPEQPDEIDSDDLVAGASSEQHSNVSDAIKQSFAVTRAYLMRTPHKETEIDLNEMKARWQESISSVQTLIEAVAEEMVSGWKLDEISVGMTVSATGKLAFVAEASAEASIHIVFKRSADKDA
jgi:hypothetical protein